MTPTFPTYYKMSWLTRPWKVSSIRLLLSLRWKPGPWTGPQIGRKADIELNRKKNGVNYERHIQHGNQLIKPAQIIV